MAKTVPNLKHSTVWRGGLTSRYINPETEDVSLNATENLELSFSIASKGGGATHVSLRIPPRDFASLASTMVAVDRQTAMLAFAKELAREVSAQPERDAEISRSAHEAVEALAHKKYIEAPIEDDEKQQLVLAEVKKLVSELQRARPK